MSFRASPWSGRPRSGYFLMRDSPCGPCIVDASQDKERIFSLLAELEAAGVACWVEDLRGERIS